MTPNLNLYGMLSDLGRGLGGIAEDERKRRMQAAIGGPLGQGDYGAAARAAFGSGDFDTGISLLKLDEATKLRKQQMEADAKALDFGGTQQPIQGSVTPGPQAGAMNLPGASLSNGKRIYDLAISKGADPREAALLASAAGAESNYNPAAVHDSGTGYGLFGHRLDRRDALFKFSGSRNPNEEQQVAFALQELRGRPEDAMARNARTPEDLARAQMFFERPKGFTEQTPEAGHNYSGRLALTRQFFPGQAAPQGVQVADASGRIPASVGVSGGVTAGTETGALEARRADLENRLLTPNISDNVRARLQSAISAIDRQLSRADRQEELSLRRQDVAQRKAETANPYERTLQQERAKNVAEQEQVMAQSARAAEMMLPHITRAEEAYKTLAGLKAIGPISASTPSRMLGGVMGSDAEAARQEYEAAAKELELAKAQISMKGQGQITESERKILGLTLPRLDAARPETGLKTLQMWRQLAEKAMGETPAQQASSGKPVASNALGQAREAIAKGAPRDAVIKRLTENGIDPSGL